MATVIIEVTSVNDAPVADDDDYDMDEDTSLALALPGALGNDSDVEGDPLTAVLIADVGSGTLILDPDGSFVYTPVADFDGQVTFTYRADDGALQSNVATVTIDVVGSADPPTATPDTYDTAEDQPLVVDALSGLLANDVDPDGDPITAIGDTLPTDGALSLSADGSFTYTPDPNFTGVDSFTYHCTDGTSDSGIVSVTLTVFPVNDPPLATDDVYFGDEDTTLIVEVATGVLDNDSDVDLDPLAAVVVSPPTNGTLDLAADGSFTYTPFLDTNGIDTFTYRADDGLLQSNIATVTLDIVPTNQAPTALDDDYAVDEDTTLGVDPPGLLFNDSDPNGDAMTVTVDTLPSDGALVMDPDGSFTFTPDPDFNGLSTFTYHVEDGQSASAAATVTIDVRPINDAPVAIDDTYITDQDAVLNEPADGVLANDSDIDGDTITAVLVSGPVGEVTLNPDGSFDYTPPIGFSGSDSFSYFAFDGTDQGNVARVTIDVVDTDTGIGTGDTGDTGCIDDTDDTGAPFVATEPGWERIDSWTVPGAATSHLHARSGTIYAGVRGQNTGDGVMSIQPADTLALRHAYGDLVSGVVTLDDGSVFWSEYSAGEVYKVPAAGEVPILWVDAFFAGDDDPAGMDVVPTGFLGTAPVNPGWIVIVDEGYSGGEDSVWMFDPDVPNSEVYVHTDDGTLSNGSDVAITLFDVFVLDTGVTPGIIYQIAVDGTLAPLVTTIDFDDPIGIAADRGSNSLIIADAATQAVYRVDNTGAVTTVVDGLDLETGAIPGIYSGVDVDPSGDRLVITETDAVTLLARCDVTLYGGGDCNANGVSDRCEIARGDLNDCDLNGIPNQCDADCPRSEVGDDTGTPPPPVGVAPFVLDASWEKVAVLSVTDPEHALYSPTHKQLAWNVRDETDGVYRMTGDGGRVLISASSNPAGLELTPTNELMFSEDYGGNLYKVDPTSTTKITWVSGLHSGDDDPYGFAFAPATYSGSVVLPGQGIVADKGSGGPNEIWGFSSDVAEGEFLLHADVGTLRSAIDVAIDDTTVYILDDGDGVSGAIYTMDAAGLLTRLITSEQLAEPFGITIDPLDGMLVVTEGANDRVVKVDPITGDVTDIVTDFPTASASAVNISPGGEFMIISGAPDDVLVLGRCEVSTHPGDDCDGNGRNDLCDLWSGEAEDCNDNQQLDSCDLDLAVEPDCDGDGIPDSCDGGCPVTTEVDWDFIHTAAAPDAMAASFNEADDTRVWYVRRGSAADGLYRMGRERAAARLSTASNPAGLAIGANGAGYYSEDNGGNLFRVDLPGDEQTWVTGWHSGDDDPAGLAFAPSTYLGNLVAPGDGIMVDRGYSGPNEVWSFLLDTSEGEAALHIDDGTLNTGIDVVITDFEAFVIDTGDSGPGSIYLVEDNGLLSTLVTSEVIDDPMGISYDPITDQLLVTDGTTGRLLGVDPVTGAVTEVLTNIHVSEVWSSVDVSDDGLQLVITGHDQIHRFARCDVATFGGTDCDANGQADFCDLLRGEPDCNEDTIPDSCQLVGNDCDLNGIPDECAVCPQVDVVFVMDTSASMDGDAQAICDGITTTVQRLKVAGVSAQAVLLGISDTPGGAYSCLTGTVIDDIGTVLPGIPAPDLAILGDCATGGYASEDWARAIAIIADQHEWSEDAVRLVVPVFDEGAHCGDPSDDPGLDRDATSLATAISLDNDTIVSPLIGAGANASVIEMAGDVAVATGGSSSISSGDVLDLIDVVYGLVGSACSTHSDCDLNGVPDECDIAAGNHPICHCD